MEKTIMNKADVIVSVLSLLRLGWHPQSVRDEAPQKQHLRGVVSSNNVLKKTRCSEGTTVDRVWVREGTGLRWRGQRVVLSLIQGDVQPLLRLVWVLCHVSLSIFATQIKEPWNRMFYSMLRQSKCSLLKKTSFLSFTPAWPCLSGGLMRHGAALLFPCGSCGYFPSLWLRLPLIQKVIL